MREREREREKKRAREREREREREWLYFFCERERARDKRMRVHRLQVLIVNIQTHFLTSSSAGGVVIHCNFVMLHDYHSTLL